ncbi:MAG: lysylphosphatidylglycerol synthase transmembrane domain-containing protein [Spartobacteria bacterium]
MTRKLITLAISLLILAAIYYKIDIHRLADVFAHTEPRSFILSLTMVIPLTLLTAARLQLIAPAHANLGFAKANRLILVASVLNMVLPSKMGDVAKAYFMKTETVSGSLALSLVIFEKTADMLSLLFWCALGLLLFPERNALFVALAAAVVIGLIAGVAILASRNLAKRVFAFGGKIDKVRTFAASWSEMQDFFWSDKSRVVAVSTMSIFIWFLHFLQIWLFIIALRASPPFVTTLALAPLAILAGLLPLTFAGIGTRDAALIVLFRPYFTAPVAAALGVLCTARYIIPALAGLPFLHRYLTKLRG